MSFVISEAIQRCNQELNIVGQLVTDQDYLLYFNRANRYYNTHYKMPTSQRTADYLLFTGVYEYPIPADMLAPMDWTRPYDLFTPAFEHYSQTPFAQFRNGNIDSIKFNKETETLLVNLTGGVTTILESFDDVGDWAVSGDASVLIQDQQYFVQGTGSLRCAVTASGGSIIYTNSNLNAFDAQSFLDAGFMFVSLYNPSNSVSVSSMTMRWGSSASDYYEMTTTEAYDGGDIDYGFNQVGFDLSAKTQTGTPDVSNMTYVEIEVANGAISGLFRIDNLIVALPYFFQLPYYSVYNIKTDAGVYIEIPTAVSDIVLCPPGFDEAYEYKVLEYASIEKLEDNGLGNYFAREMKLKENKLKQQFPRQDTLMQTNWYRPGNRF